MDVICNAPFGSGKEGPLLDVRGPNVDAVNLYLARRTEQAAAAASAREREAVHMG